MPQAPCAPRRAAAAGRGADRCCGPGGLWVWPEALSRCPECTPPSAAPPPCTQGLEQARQSGSKRVKAGGSSPRGAGGQAAHAQVESGPAAGAAARARQGARAPRRAPTPSRVLNRGAASKGPHLCSLSMTCTTSLIDTMPTMLPSSICGDQGAARGSTGQPGWGQQGWGRGGGGVRAPHGEGQRMVYAGACPGAAGSSDAAARRQGRAQGRLHASTHTASSRAAGLARGRRTFRQMATHAQQGIRAAGPAQKGQVHSLAHGNKHNAGHTDHTAGRQGRVERLTTGRCRTFFSTISSITSSTLRSGGAQRSMRSMSAQGGRRAGGVVGGGRGGAATRSKRGL